MELPGNHNGAAHAKAKAKTAAPDGSVKAALEALAALDINQLSPVEALTKSVFNCVYGNWRLQLKNVSIERG